MKKRKKIKKSSKAKFIRRRRILGLVLLSTFIVLISIISKTIYTKIKCKNFNYSVHYYLTNNSSDEELMRVKDFSLTFYDKDFAIVEAYGLQKSAPHKSLIVEGRFKKDYFGSWILEKTYLVNNS